MASEDSRGQNEGSPETLDVLGLAFALAPGLLVLLGCLLFIAVARLFSPLIFEPRQRMAMPFIEDVSPRLSKNPFMALLQVVTAPMPQVSATVGLDAMAFCSNGRMMLGVTSIWIVLSIALFPAYCPGDHWKEHEELDDDIGFAPLSQCSVSNLAHESSRLWATVVGTYAFTLILFGGLLLDLRFVQGMKEKYQRHRRPARYYSVMLEAVPKESRNPESIQKFFEDRDYAVASVTPMRFLGGDFYKTEAKYEQAWWGLHKAKVAEQDGQKMVLTRLPFPRCFYQVLAVEHFTKEVEALRSELARYQKDYSSLEASDVAFVTFSSLADAARACSMFELGYVDINDAETGWRVCAAPEPRDVYWESLESYWSNTFGIWAFLGGRAFLWVGTAFIIIVWIIPILGIQELRIYLEKQSGTVMQSLAALVPPLALVTVNWIGHTLLHLIARNSGLYQKRLVQHKCMWQNFYFLMVDTFIVTFFSASILGAANDDNGVDSSDPVRRLGEAMPRAASFYFLFIFSQAFYSIPPLVAFPGSLQAAILNMSWLLPQGRIRDVAMDPGSPRYAHLYAYDAFIFSLTFCFGLLAPGVLVAGWVFCLLSHVLMKYQLLYNYRTEFQAEGYYVIPAARQVLVGNVVGQVCVFIVVLVKGSLSCFSLIPLMVVTVALCISLPYIFTKLNSEGLHPDLAKEFDSEVAEDAGEGSQKQRRSKQAALEAARNGHWHQPKIREDLDHPFPGRFFWRDAAVDSALTVVPPASSPATMPSPRTDAW